MSEAHTDTCGHNAVKTVLEIDLVGYSDIALVLEENLNVRAVKTFQDQIQEFVDYGLGVVGLKRDDIVLGTAGDNAILIFDNAATMHHFAQAVHQQTSRYNAKKSLPMARRWFRMGAATGTVLMTPVERRIVGFTVVRSVRLEAAANKGQLVIDHETYESLPKDLQKTYGPEELIPGKREERFKGHRCILTYVPNNESGNLDKTDLDRTEVVESSGGTASAGVPILTKVVKKTRRVEFDLTKIHDEPLQPLPQTVREYSSFLLRAHVIGSQTIRCLHGQDELKKLNKIFEAYLHHHRNEDVLVEDAKISLEAATGLMIVARFSKGWFNFTDNDATNLINKAEALVEQVISVDPCIWTRTRQQTEKLYEIVELLADYKIDRMSCERRHLLLDNKDLDDALERFRRGLRRGIPASERRYHAELYSAIVGLVNARDFERLKYMQENVRDRIRHVRGKHAPSINKQSTVFLHWSNDLVKQPDFDIYTILARLWETEAKLLLVNNLSYKTLAPRDARSIAALLYQAEWAFGKSCGIWWHGVGNVILTKAVLSNYQNNRRKTYNLLNFARDIFDGTNDLMRRNMVSDIMGTWEEFRDVGLDERKICMLLFGE